MKSKTRGTLVLLNFGFLLILISPFLRNISVILYFVSLIIGVILAIVAVITMIKNQKRE